ncbi:MAG: hypothetical protein R3B51_01295 [Thermodesulfobacteriota bacterium]
MLGKKPVVIDIDDPFGPGGERLGEAEYEDFLASGDPSFRVARPKRRMGRHIGSLYFRHDRQSERRRLPPQGART